MSDTYLRNILRITDDFDSFSVGATDRFRCIAKVENKQLISSTKSNEVTVSDTTDNPHLVLVQADTEATMQIDFEAVVTDPPGTPDLTSFVAPFKGYFVFQPLYEDKRISKITITSALTTAQNSYIGLFYAGV